MALRTPLSVTPHLYMGDSTGRPLDNGVVYFGEQDKDPEFYPIELFSDDKLTKPLMQPVHTKGGYLYDKGDMVEPHAKELIYSVKVLDSYGRKVFYKGAMMRNSWNDDVIDQINTAIIGSADAARQVAIDITNDAINNTAVEGGVLADTFVTVTANNGTIARNLRDVNSDRLDLRDFGILEDGEDKTADIVALMQGFSSDKRAVINASSGTRFNAGEVLKSLPVGVSIELNGARSGHYTSTYKQKFYGILANDAVNDDTVHVVETGHNPALALINHRTAGTDSGNRGAATILYGLGRIRGGGQRSVSIQQWDKKPTGKWSWSIRSVVPWESVDDKDNMYEPWSAGDTVRVGDYRIYKSVMYQSQSAGVTGDTPPTHLEGDVAYEGIIWRKVFLGDTTVLAIDEAGSFAVNSTPVSTEQVSFNQNVNDIDYPIYRMGINAKGKNKSVILKFSPTDSDGADVMVPHLIASPNGELNVATGGQVTSVCSFDKNSVTLKAVNYKSSSAEQGSETPNVSNVSSLVINNSTATTITDLIGAVNEQRVSLLFANANTTLKHGTNIRLQGSVDVTPTALSVITLQKFRAGALTSAWIEVSRSIK